MEHWVWDRLVQCKQDMMAAWEKYASLANKIGCEKAYIHCSMAECGKQWDDLFEQVPKRQEVVSTNIPEERYENLQKLCAKLRHQVRSQNQTAYEVLEVLQGRIHRQDTTLDYIHTTLQKEVVMLREQLFRARHPSGDSEFNAEEFCLIDFVNFADNTLKDTAQAVAQALQNKLQDTSPHESATLASLELRARDAEWKQKIDKMKNQHETELVAVVKQLEASRTQLAQKQVTLNVTVAEKDKQIAQLTKRLGEVDFGTEGSDKSEGGSPTRSRKATHPDGEASGALDMRRVSQVLEALSKAQGDLAAATPPPESPAGRVRQDSDTSEGREVADILNAHRKEVATLDGLYGIKLQNLVLKWESALKEYEAKAERDFKDLLGKNDGLFRKCEALQEEVDRLTRQLATAERRAEVNVRQQHASALNDLNKIAKGYKELREKAEARVKELEAEVKEFRDANSEGVIIDLRSRILELERELLGVHNTLSAKETQRLADLEKAEGTAAEEAAEAEAVHKDEIERLERQVAETTTRAEAAECREIEALEGAKRAELVGRGWADITLAVASADPDVAAQVPHAGKAAAADPTAAHVVASVAHALMHKSFVDLGLTPQPRLMSRRSSKRLKSPTGGMARTQSRTFPRNHSSSQLAPKKRSGCMSPRSTAVGSPRLGKRQLKVEVAELADGDGGLPEAGTLLVKEAVANELSADGDNDTATGSRTGDPLQASALYPLVFTPISPFTPGFVGDEDSAPLPQTFEDALVEVQRLRQQVKTHADEAARLRADVSLLGMPMALSRESTGGAAASDEDAAQREEEPVVEEVGEDGEPQRASRATQTPHAWWHLVAAATHAHAQQPRSQAAGQPRPHVHTQPQAHPQGQAVLPPVYTTDGSLGPSVTPADGQEHWWQAASGSNWNSDDAVHRPGGLTSVTVGDIRPHAPGSAAARGVVPRIPSAQRTRDGARVQAQTSHVVLGDGLDNAAGTETVDARPVTTDDFVSLKTSQPHTTRGQGRHGRSAGSRAQTAPSGGGEQARGGVTLQSAFDVTPPLQQLATLDGGMTSSPFMGDACVVFTSFPSLTAVPRPPVPERPSSGPRPGTQRARWEAVAKAADGAVFGSSWQVPFDDLPQAGQARLRAPANAYLGGLRLSEKKRLRYNSRHGDSDWEETVETRVVDADTFRRTSPQRQAHAQYTPQAIAARTQYAQPRRVQAAAASRAPLEVIDGPDEGMEGDDIII